MHNPGARQNRRGAHGLFPRFWLFLSPPAVFLEIGRFARPAGHPGFLSMKRVFFSIVPLCLLLLASGLFSADRVVEVQPGENVETFAKRYLNNPRQWKTILVYNNLKSGDFRPGLKIKIPEEQARKPDAVVVSYQKVARYSRSNSENWGAVEQGLGIFRMDRIATDSSGFVNLVFQNAMQVQIKPSTRVIINFSSVGGSSDLFLQEGRIRSFTTTPGKQTAFRVHTPTAVASVRGTDFQTDVEGSGRTTVACHEGVVEVSAQGKTVKLNKGFRTVVEPGKQPDEPQELLPPPKPL